MAPKDLKALRLLMDHPRGLYGSELVALSEGYLSRGTIYTLLDRLVERGFVREVEEPPTPSLQIARTRHFITAVGQRAIQQYAREMGFAIIGTVAGGAA
jgi:DNA-binding PadR family transcriptional regulator